MLKIREVEWNQIYFFLGGGGPGGKNYGFNGRGAPCDLDRVFKAHRYSLVQKLGHLGSLCPLPVRHPATSMHLSYRLASKSRKWRRGGHLLTSIHFIIFFSTSLLRYCLLCPVWARYDMISIINNLLTISQAGKPSRISISPSAPLWNIITGPLCLHYYSFIERRGQNKRMNSNKMIVKVNKIIVDWALYIKLHDEVWKIMPIWYRHMLLSSKRHTHTGRTNTRGSFVI